MLRAAVLSCIRVCRARGRLIGLGVALLFPLVLVSAQPALASNGTHVSGTISSNTTWTLAGSPYVLDGNVTVATGATLTVEPGVVVKLNGQLRTLTVAGVLRAVGTSSQRITFTSIQDDTVGGDSGGDGSTAGAPGQWFQIFFNSSNDLSEFRHVDVRYGGYGSADWAYGAINVGGSATVTIDHATVTNNQRSGVKVSQGCGSCYPGVVVSESTIAQNANGISVSQGWLRLESNSSVRANSRDGVWFNLISTYAGLTSSLTDSTSRRTGGMGLILASPRPFRRPSGPPAAGTTSTRTAHASSTTFTPATRFTRLTGAAITGEAGFTSTSTRPSVGMSRRTRPVISPIPRAGLLRRTVRSPGGRTSSIDRLRNRTPPAHTTA